MSKKEFKKYIHSLSRHQLEDQLLDMYSRFKDVKEYYDFAFNPNEGKIIEEAKFKVSKEYFPVNGRKAKKRRSVAQKYIRHFRTLGMDAQLIADFMLYNIEIAQTYCAENNIKQDSFYQSMLKSFREAVTFIDDHHLNQVFRDRMEGIVEASIDQHWFNHYGFEQIKLS